MREVFQLGPPKHSHKARDADILTYCYPKCTALLLLSLLRKVPEAALGRLFQKNYLTMLLPISKFTRYPCLLAFLLINVVVQVQSQQIVSQWWLWKLNPFVPGGEAIQLSWHKFSAARNRDRGTCLLPVPPTDTFVGLSFEAGAEV